MANKSKIKLLILSHSSKMDGAERSMLDLFEYWVKKDEVDPLFVIKKPVLSAGAELTNRKWRFLALDYSSWASSKMPQRRPADEFRNSLNNTKAIFEIEKLIKKFKPDLVMTNTIVAPWAALAAYFQKIPHVWFVREYGKMGSGQEYSFDIGREKTFHDIDLLSQLIVPNSKSLANYLTNYVTESKISPLYTPFDLAQLHSKLKENSPNPFKDKSSLKLVITGRISVFKGQAEVAEAVGMLNKQGFNTELCVIGRPDDPEDAEPLMAVIEKYNLVDKVHLIGSKTNPLSYLKYANVGIMTSKWEAFGRVTFEYMVAGLPVIGANSGATPELVQNGKNGLLYEPGNIDDLVKQLLIYAKNPDQAKKHGANAKARAKTILDDEANADALLEKVKKLVGFKVDTTTRPTNFMHRWLEYPSIAEQYIKEAKDIPLKRMLHSHLRHRAKWAYLTLARPINFVRRGFKRSSSSL